MKLKSNEASITFDKDDASTLEIICGTHGINFRQYPNGNDFVEFIFTEKSLGELMWFIDDKNWKTCNKRTLSIKEQLQTAGELRFKW